MRFNEEDIDFDANCDKCGKPGRCPNGLCLACIAKALQEHLTKVLAAKVNVEYPKHERSMGGMLNWKRAIGLTLAFMSLQTFNVIPNDLPFLSLFLGFMAGLISFNLLFPEILKGKHNEP